MGMSSMTCYSYSSFSPFTSSEWDDVNTSIENMNCINISPSLYASLEIEMRQKNEV